jgi:hypothetical protein
MHVNFIPATTEVAFTILHEAPAFGDAAPAGGIKSNGEKESIKAKK